MCRCYHCATGSAQPSPCKLKPYLLPPPALGALQLKPIPGLEPGPAEAGAMEQLLPLLSGTATDP